MIQQCLTTINQEILPQLIEDWLLDIPRLGLWGQVHSISIILDRTTPNLVIFGSLLVFQGKVGPSSHAHRNWEGNTAWGSATCLSAQGNEQRPTMPWSKMTKSRQVGTIVFVKKQSWVNGRTPLLICYTTFRKLPYYPDPGVLGFVFTSTMWWVVIKAYTCDGRVLPRFLKGNRECLFMLDDLEKREQIKY